jgi:hypothetical protein
VLIGEALPPAAHSTADILVGIASGLFAFKLSQDKNLAATPERRLVPLIQRTLDARRNMGSDGASLGAADPNGAASDADAKVLADLSKLLSEGTNGSKQ